MFSAGNSVLQLDRGLRSGNTRPTGNNRRVAAGDNVLQAWQQRGGFREQCPTGTTAEGWLPGTTSDKHNSRELAAGGQRPTGPVAEGWLLGTKSDRHNSSVVAAGNNILQAQQRDCREHTSGQSYTGCSWWLDGSKASTRINLRLRHPATGSLESSHVFPRSKRMWLQTLPSMQWC